MVYLSGEKKEDMRLMVMFHYVRHPFVLFLWLLHFQSNKYVIHCELSLNQVVKLPFQEVMVQSQIL